MLALVLVLGAAAQAVTPAIQFERGKAAYDRGEYARAIGILRPLLYPEIRLESEGQVVQTHRMLGVAHLFGMQNQNAAQEFRKLLQLRPDFRFDAILDPPQVVDFFNGVLREQEAEIARITAMRKEAELAARREREALERARNGPVIVEKRYARNSFALNFVPFGVGQFQNGQRGKGWAFLASESLLAAVSVSALATNFALYGASPKRRPCLAPAEGAGAECARDRTDEERSKLLLQTQVVSGALFFGVAAWGIVDALLNHQAETPLPVPGNNAAGRVAIAPVVLPSGLGAGLSFRF